MGSDKSYRSETAFLHWFLKNLFFIYFFFLSTCIFTSTSRCNGTQDLLDDMKRWCYCSFDSVPTLFLPWEFLTILSIKKINIQNFDSLVLLNLMCLSIKGHFIWLVVEIFRILVSKLQWVMLAFSMEVILGSIVYWIKMNITFVNVFWHSMHLGF